MAKKTEARDFENTPEGIDSEEWQLAVWICHSGTVENRFIENYADSISGSTARYKFEEMHYHFPNIKPVFLTLPSGTIIYEVSRRPFHPGEKATKYKVLGFEGTHLRIQKCSEPWLTQTESDWKVGDLEIWDLNP